MSQLPISNVINVSLANAQAGLNAPNTGNLVIFTNEIPGPSFGSGAYAAYEDPSSVQDDFGSASETFAMANGVFSQQPNILLPGGQLLVVPFLNAVQTLTLSGVPASGAFEIVTPNGTSASIMWNSTAAAIQTIIQAIPGCSGWTVSGSLASESLIVTCGGTYGPVDAFTVASNTLETSASAAITFTIATTVAGETLAEALTRASGFLLFFGVISTIIHSQADILAAAAVAQPLAMLLGVVSNKSADLTPSTGTFAQVASGSFNHTRCLYYGPNVVSIAFSAVPASGAFVISYGSQDSASIAFNATAATIQSDLQALLGLSTVTVSGSIAAQNLLINMLGTQGPAQISISSNTLQTSASASVLASVSYQQTDPLVYLASYFGSGMSVDFEGSNTTITMNLKSLVGVLPDLTMTQTIQNSCTAVGADTYPSIQGDPAVLSAGANLFFDQAQNRVWFATDIAISGYNYLAQTNTKVPQTESGMSGLKSAYRQVCQQGITNQYLAPGSWNSGTTFGDQALFLANISQKGYYIYSAPVALQSQADRAARVAPLVQIAVKEAGAIHKSSVLIFVNA